MTSDQIKGILEIDFSEAWMPYVLVNQAGFIVYENQAAIDCLGQTNLGKMFNQLFCKEEFGIESLRKEIVREKMNSLYYRRKYAHSHTLKRIKQNSNEVDFEALILKNFFKIKQDSYLLVGIVDISEEIKHEYHLSFMANHDLLTGLPNRRALSARLKILNEQVKRYKRSFGLFYLDINRFKTYNDKYSHEFGDRILVEFARAINKVKRKSDELFRVGGDEFIYIAEGAGSTHQMQSTAQRLIRATNHIALIADPKLTVSIGSVRIKNYCDLAFAPLIEQADKASYQAKGEDHNMSSHVFVETA